MVLRGLAVRLLRRSQRRAALQLTDGGAVGQAACEAGGRHCAYPMACEHVRCAE